MFTKQDDFQKHKYDCFLNNSNLNIDTALREAENFLPPEEIRSQMKQLFTNHTWRSCDCFIRSRYLETNFEKELRKIPTDIINEWGFDENHIEKYVIRSGNKTKWQAGFTILGKNEDIKTAYYSFKNTIKISDVDIMKEILHKKRLNSDLLSNYNKGSLSIAAAERRMKKYNITQEDLTAAYEGRNNFKNLSCLADSIGNEKWNTLTKKGYYLKQLFDVYEFDISKLPFRVTPRERRKVI